MAKHAAHVPSRALDQIQPCSTSSFPAYSVSVADRALRIISVRAIVMARFRLMSRLARIASATVLGPAPVASAFVISFVSVLAVTSSNVASRSASGPERDAPMKSSTDLVGTLTHDDRTVAMPSRVDGALSAIRSAD